MPQLKMRPTYKIFVMDEDEFNGLHKYIPEVKKKDLEKGLGFANPKTKECYIKRTGVKEWDDETIIHEAEELLAKHSSHEDEQNIRWKSESNFFNTGAGKAITAAVVGLATGGLGLPALAAAGTGALTGGIMGYQTDKSPGILPGVISGGLSGYGGGLAGAGAAKGATAAGPGFFSKAGGALKGAGKGLLGTSSPATELGTLQGPVTKAQSAQGFTNLSQVPITKTFPASTIGTAPGVSGAIGPTGGTAVPGYSSYNVKDVLGSTASNVLKSPFTPQLPTPSTAPTASTGAGGVSTGTPSLLKGAGEKVAEFAKTPANILGITSMGASMLPKTPQFEMPSYVSDLRTKLMEGEALSPLGQQARSSLAEILGSEPTELYPTANDEYYNAALRRTRESYGEAGKRLDAAYNMAGVYGSGEHLAEKAKLQEELARTESALYAQTEQRRFELARTTQYQAIQDSLGVDKATMDDIVGLTGLDVQTAAMVYGAQVADITAIRESLGTIGMELMLRGTGLKSDKGMNV